LVPKVEKAMGAYQICKDRLDKVQATFGQYIQKDGTPESDAHDNGEGAAKKALLLGTRRERDSRIYSENVDQIHREAIRKHAINLLSSERGTERVG
jgi:hypothetical protein